MIDPRLLEHWESEWNHSDEFWCMLGATGEVVMANSHFKEWFEINFDLSLIGVHPGHTMNNEPFDYKSREWQTVHRVSRMVRTPTREDIKLVFDGDEYIGAMAKVFYKDDNIRDLDMELAQSRLDNFHGVTRIQPSNVVNLFA